MRLISVTIFIFSNSLDLSIGSTASGFRGAYQYRVRGGTCQTQETDSWLAGAKDPTSATLETI